MREHRVRKWCEKVREISEQEHEISKVKRKNLKRKVSVRK